MTNTRRQIPPTNLKERIAALEQRNAGNGGTNTRPTSPTGSDVSTGGGHMQPAGALREKIAKFERKGGVPVPRGSFGLGAPPTNEGPRRQGELYGNRIPAPTRAASGGVVPSSRAGSPDPSLSDRRRSFSISSIMSDDDHLDYTPITSPTFAFPLDSPESTVSVSFTPEASPSSLSTNGDPASLKHNIVRGTPFQKALEIARNTENAKQEALTQGQAQDPTTPMQRLQSLENQEEEVELPEHTPAIVLSSEDSTPVIVHHSPKVESSLFAPAASEASAPGSGASSEVSEAQPKHIDDAVAHSVEETPVMVKEEYVVEIVPLMIRKRSPTDLATERSNESNAEETQTVLAAEEIKPKEALDTITPSESTDKPLTEPKDDVNITPVVEAVPVEVVEKESAMSSSVVVKESKEIIPAVNQPSPAKSKVDVPLPVKHEATNIQPSVALPPPEIIVHNEYTPAKEAEAKVSFHDASSNAETASRKTVLTLDADRLAGDSIMSPSVATNMSSTSLTDVISNYFAGGAATVENGNRTFRTTTPPPLLPASSPESPMATLPYDAPETPRSPRTKAPDSQFFLSPPASGLHSAAPSSFGSTSSIGSRPMSMIETSPGKVSRALRMTPATSRGVPMFFPPNSSRPRKPDFVYFPPTPDAVETEFGSVTLNKSSQPISVSHPRRGSEADLTSPSARSTTFTAVVHGKVKETPASATAPSSFPSRQQRMPETPQMQRVKRATILEPPPSPGQGELAALLQEAVWLEDTLIKGELPSEVARRMQEEERQSKVLEEAAKEEEAKAKEEERQKIAFANAQLQAKRDQPTSGRLKHTLLMPLSKARSVHRKEVSSSAAERFPDKLQEGRNIHPKSAGLPGHSGSGGIRAAAAATRPEQKPHQAEVPRPVTPEGRTTTPSQVPSKSPRARFASFRRLGSITHPNTIHGASTRNSNTSSELSSEDSAPAATPPEHMSEFGMKSSSVSELGHGLGQSDSTLSFPSLSPKKSLSSMNRATSFAGKMWSRSRTKSNGSHLSSTSELTDHLPEDSVPRLPAFGLSPAIQLPSFSPPPSPDNQATLFQPPMRSTSLKRTVGLPPLPTTAVPPLPTITSSDTFHPQLPSTPSEFSNDSLFLPASPHSTRPSSWTSYSSAGSLPSPLFDKAMFDAFPSVPGTMPTPPSITYNFGGRHRRDMSLASAAAATSSFDSALLSSAIHLASSHKSSAATTPVSTTMPRRSGDTVR